MQLGAPSLGAKTCRQQFGGPAAASGRLRTKRKKKHTGRWSCVRKSSCAMHRPHTCAPYRTQRRWWARGCVVGSSGRYRVIPFFPRRSFAAPASLPFPSYSLLQRPRIRPFLQQRRPAFLGAGSGPCFSLLHPGALRRQPFRLSKSPNSERHSPFRSHPAASISSAISRSVSFSFFATDRNEWQS